jgi:hypothetical protein
MLLEANADPSITNHDGTNMHLATHLFFYNVYIVRRICVQCCCREPAPRKRGTYSRRPRTQVYPFLTVTRALYGAAGRGMLNNDADMIITNIKNGGYINIRYEDTGCALLI